MSLFTQKIFLTLMLLMGVGAASAAQASVVPDNGCFAISGTHHDGNGALQLLTDAENAHTQFGYAGYRCSIFNSYQELKAHLASEAKANEQDPSTGLAIGSSILVIQIAHGGPGGGALLNSNLPKSMTPPEQLRSAYEDLSSRYHVALINQSCYAGDLMENLLDWEDQHADSPMMKNMCLVTDSIPGRVAVSINKMDRSSLGGEITLEDFFLSRPDGMISSAAWSQSKLVKYAIPRVNLPSYPLFAIQHPDQISSLTPIAEESLAQMNQMFAQDASLLSSTNRSYVQNARVALKGTFSAEKMGAYLKVKSLAQLGSDEMQGAQASFYGRIRSQDSCALAIRDYLSSSWNPSLQSGKFWATFLQQLMATSRAVLPSCNDAPSNTDPVAWASWLAIRSDVGTLLMPFALAQSKFNVAFGVETYDYDGVVNDLLNSSVSASEEVQLSQFLSAIGITVNPNEYEIDQVETGLSSNVAVPTLGIAGATGNVIPAFSIMSLIQPTLPNPLDQERRDACRSIQLKALR
jgi:hypothetical protein